MGRKLGDTTHLLLGDSGVTLQGINISHLGKRKIIFKMPFLGDMLASWRVLTIYLLSSLDIAVVKYQNCWDDPSR